MSAIVSGKFLSKIFRTSYRTMTGTRIRKSLSKYGAKRSALWSPVMYSSQPEESITTDSVAVVSVTVVVLPFQTLGHATKILDGAGRTHPDGAIDGVNVELLAWFQLQGFPDLLRDNDLKLWGDFYGFH